MCMHKKMSSYNDAEHEEDEDEKYEEDVQKEEERTCLAEAIHSILDTRPELTLAWAESVRKILQSTDLSSPNPSSSSSSNDASSDPCCHTLGPWRHDQHQDRIVAGLEGELLLLKTALRVSNLHRRQILNRVLDLKDDVFLEVEPIVRSALDGHNVCIFAYGQTGTGKTFTMEGNKDQPGVIPCTLQWLFDEACFDKTMSYSFSLSMLEVYKGRLRDLLVCQQHSAQCTHPASKCLLRITITCAYVLDNHKFATTSKLWLVDLGGSERLSKTNAQGVMLEEGKSINVSLSALGDVISALQRKQPHVPYRNSKLTQLLRDCLGEQSKTLMLVHVSPKEMDMAETVCSLSFACRARGTHLGRELSKGKKRERAAAIAELYKLMSIHDDECRSLQDSIKTIEALIEERKAFLLQSIEHCNSKNKQPDHQPIGSKSSSNNLQVQSPSFFTPSSKTWPLGDSLKTLPRFMSPTASSRHKQCSEEIAASNCPSDQNKQLRKAPVRQARNCKTGNSKSPETAVVAGSSNLKAAMSEEGPSLLEKSFSSPSVIKQMIEEAALEDPIKEHGLSGGEDMHNHQGREDENF
ncbi:hypothetical protein CY35_09G001300 [Sphagnum magellanicum]|nr:hypothetical protein CY35_09G001300 [Sphagnum magellanicum]KAH9551177.1 hypothetical protein CY35_09G001300 [Sphagnum magellanicum]